MFEPATSSDPGDENGKSEGRVLVPEWLEPWFFCFIESFLCVVATSLKIRRLFWYIAHAVELAE